jgi:hypothetical protein
VQGARKHRPPARKFAFITRRQAIREAAQRLQHHGWPRLQMLLIVGITGLAGFFASVVFLAAGVEQMWQRYPLAIGVAYLVFLLQLWWWMHASHDDNGDVVDSLDFGNGGGGGGGLEGGGGHFTGGGASGSWDPIDPGVGDALGSVAESAGDTLGSAVDGADEGCLVVVVVVVLVFVFGSLFAGAVYLVYGAPMLLAELLVDAALSFGLYRNLRRQDREFWLFTAVRRTGWQFLAVAVFAAVLGMLLAHKVPGARTFGDAMQGKAVFREESE